MRRTFTRASNGLCYVSASALFAAMALVTVDVILRAATNRPIFGATDIVELLFAISLFCALPATFWHRQHVVVDVIDTVVSPRVIRGLVWISAVFAVVLLALMLWRIAYPVSDMAEKGQSTLNIEIPRWIYGAVAIFGLFVSLLMQIARLFVDVNPAASDAPAASKPG